MSKVSTCTEITRTSANRTLQNSYECERSLTSLLSPSCIIRQHHWAYRRVTAEQTRHNDVIWSSVGSAAGNRLKRRLKPSWRGLTCRSGVGMAGRRRGTLDNPSLNTTPASIDRLQQQLLFVWRLPSLASFMQDVIKQMISAAM